MPTAKSRMAICLVCVSIAARRTHAAEFVQRLLSGGIDDVARPRAEIVMLVETMAEEDLQVQGDLRRIRHLLLAAEIRKKSQAGADSSLYCAKSDPWQSNRHACRVAAPK